MKDLLKGIETKIKRYEECYDMYLKKYEEYFDKNNTRRYYEERMNITRAKINILHEVVVMIKENVNE